jgi:hypothetical protein
VYVEPVAGFGVECPFEEVARAACLLARQQVRDAKEIQHLARLRRNEYGLCVVRLHDLPQLIELASAV